MYIDSALRGCGFSVSTCLSLHDAKTAIVAEIIKIMRMIFITSRNFSNVLQNYNSSTDIQIYFSIFVAKTYFLWTAI